MFFREKRLKGSKHPVLQLIQNQRTPKGPRQRVVASLGTRMDIPKNLRSTVAQLVEDHAARKQVRVTALIREWIYQRLHNENS